MENNSKENKKGKKSKAKPPKTPRPIILHLPTLIIEKLNNRFLSNAKFIDYDIDKLCYIVHYIMIKHQIENKKDFIPINPNTLGKIVHNYKSYLKILTDKEMGILLCDGKYRRGEKAYWYRVNEEFLDGRTSMHIITPKKWIYKNIIKSLRNQKAHYNRLATHLKVMLDKVKALDFDYLCAREWIEKNAEGKKKTSYLISLSQIEDSRFRYFKRNKTNRRLDTNFTNLKKEIRGFIKGEKMVSIDLKNSQPLLLSYLIKHIINNYEITENKLIYRNNTGDTLCQFFRDNEPARFFGIKAIKKILVNSQNDKNELFGDIFKYGEIVKRGQLYQEFKKYYGESQTRKMTKEIIFKVFFSQNRTNKNKAPYIKDKKKFIELFPTVYMIIFELKRKYYKALSIYLQNLESYIFIDSIAKELVEEGIVPLTIHDSVVIEERHQYKAMRVINEVFKRNFGLLPEFDFEPINPPKEDFRIEEPKYNLSA